MKSKLIKGIIICLVVVGIGVGGYYGYRKYASSKVTASAVSYMKVSAKNMDMKVNVQGTGSAFATVSKDIITNNNGTIKDLNVNVGDKVKKGDKLFFVDSDQLTQNLSKAESNLEKQKLQLSKAKTSDDIAMQNLAIDDAQNEVNYAMDAINKMTVTSPIDGVVVAKNNVNGDTAQSGKAILTVADTTSMKIKVAVDELDIDKVKLGQKAEIKFDAIKDKVFEGTVEYISQVGNSSNNVTTYDVTVGIKDPTNIKIGMNANVNILVQSKANALVIPAEALIEKNGNKYVMVASGSNGTDNSKASDSNSSNVGFQNSQSNGEAGTNRRQSGSGAQGAYGQASGSGRNSSRFMTSGGGKLVQIKTGLENENYIEVLEGVTEGEQLLVQLPQASSTNTMNNRSNFGGGLGGSFGGGLNGAGAGMGSGRTQRSNNSEK
ncbi:efflux RND transporter periplasmic adaptor subunit [Clostridium lundense]|uniref:efflux RND transporter periplasmic adaptor subunit n=1 Tax=Clostridium lundense TaxID=319475 RepID=UPI0004834FF3|nr:efflux RND transporter periplasmic adaptor subunit [Clostridium lundense]